MTKFSMNYEGRSVFALFFVVPIAYFSSFFLLTYYVGGDQIFYRDLYAALSGAGFDNVFSLVREHVSGREPVTALVLWLGAALGINKDVYISILNVFLVSGIFLLCRKHRVNFLVTLMLLSNFYVVVLMTGAERLKIAFIFLTVAALLSGRARLLFLGLSPLAHLQSLVLWPSVILASFEPAIRRLIVSKKVSKRVLRLMFLIGLFGALVGVVLFDAIRIKAAAYVARDVPLADLVDVAVLSVIALYVTLNRFRMVLVLAPIYPAIALLGGFRVNMIAVVLVVYFLMIEKRLSHPLVYALLGYFVFKTFIFVNNVVFRGDGFAYI